MKQLISQITNIVGPQGILSGNEVQQRAAGIWRSDPILAKAIVRPKDTHEVSAILKLCNDAKQTVVTQGGLTNLTHSADTRVNDIVLSLERMNNIEEVDPINRTISLQTGTLLQSAQEAASNTDLYLPLDLGARGSCTIGGNLASNAGGNKVIRYGMARDITLGLEVVLADGNIISSMNKLIKNNTGYDLKQLFIGSEGTLGVITRAVLRLREQPLSQNTALLATNQFEHVLSLLRFFDAQLGGNLCAFEVMWNNFYKTAASSPPLKDNHAFYILLEAFGTNTEHDHIHFEKILEKALAQNLIDDAVIAKSEKERQALWAIRDNVSELNQYKPLSTFDVSLPLNFMQAYIDRIQNQIDSQWPNAQCFIFGHLGDNNLHIIVAANSDKHAQTHEKLEQIIYQPLAKYNGSISAEHGIGLEKKMHLNICRSDNEINLMRQIKHSLDPNWILNPGKIFD